MVFNKKTLVRFLLMGLILTNIILTQVNIAVAANTVPITAQTYSGGENSIRDLLCAPPKSGSTSNSSALFECINKLYRVAIVVAGIVGMFMITLAGYLYMTAAGSTDNVSKAKSYISSTMGAIVILLVGYVLLRALNPDLLEYKNVLPPVPVGTTPPAGTPPVTTPPPAGTANLCAPTSSSCTRGVCGQYTDAIKRAAQQVTMDSSINKEALIRAIMFAESSCGTNLVSPAKSYGIMQLQVATANAYKAGCGVTETVTMEWLLDSKNFEKSICIGAQYLAFLSRANVCGSQIRNIAAGYNGGQGSLGACGASSNCANETSCSNEPVKRWECLYDDNAHTIPNTGYNETRVYAPKVLGCYNTNS